MRRGRILIILAIVVILGVFAVVLVLRNLDQPIGETVGLGESITDTSLGRLVIAAQDIQRGAMILEDAVILSPFPTELIIEGTMMTDIESVVGRFARMDIARGVPITNNMLTDLPGDVADTGSETAFVIPPGYTAISIPMDRLSGVAFAVQDGDQVDVLISLLMLDLDAEFQTAQQNLLGSLYTTGELLGGEPVPLTIVVDEPGQPRGRIEVDPATGLLVYVVPSEPQRPRLVSQRLISGATVLHVGTFPFEGAAPAAAAEGQGVGAETAQGEAEVPAVEPPDIITLIVTPQDALALNWAMKVGADLVLTLRSPNDGTVVETTSVTLQFLLENYNISVPSNLTIGIEPRLETPITPVLPNDQQETEN
ncbi:MAG: SAF domain-containing protein [Anaerolineales bacterium]|jgi:pilus assembly protein CpaB